MTLRTLVLASCLVVPLLARAAAIAPNSANGNWPREIDGRGIHLAIYQPQVDGWKDNRIEARAAVIVMRREQPTQIFGTVSINARTEVDKEARLVFFEDITVRDANFPSAAGLQSTLLKAVRESVPDWPRTVSLDRLLADLAITKAETKVESIRPKNDLPKIIFASNRLC
jgi:hypothetical protein